MTRGKIAHLIKTSDGFTMREELPNGDRDVVAVDIARSPGQPVVATLTRYLLRKNGTVWMNSFHQLKVESDL